MAGKKKKASKKRTAKASTSPRKSGRGLAVVSLILNSIILPGIGSLVGRKTKEGIWQLILFIGGAIIGYYYFTPAGLLPIAAWIWGIVTGIKLIRESR